MPLRSLSPVSKAIIELAALVLIWLGTLAITLGGLPELVTAFYVDERGAFYVAPDGAFEVRPPEPEAVAAYDQYVWWARMGEAGISLGMLLQATAPASVILAAARSRTRRPRRSAASEVQRLRDQLAGLED